jgi:hypothetical protein
MQKMNSVDRHSVDSKNARKTIVFVAAGAVLILSATLMVFYSSGLFTSHSRQEEIAARGVQVMPFDLEQTTHVFEKLDDGGLQKVVGKDPANKKQIALIQSHLKEESERFRKGDFSDPAKIHGENMPGLAELKAGAGKIDVRYADLSDGAQIRYTAKDPGLVMALHQWFSAQLSDHGHHASGH